MMSSRLPSAPPHHRCRHLSRSIFVGASPRSRETVHELVHHRPSTKFLGALHRTTIVAALSFPVSWFSEHLLQVARSVSIGFVRLISSLTFAIIVAAGSHVVSTVSLIQLLFCSRCHICPSVTARPPMSNITLMVSANGKGWHPESFPSLPLKRARLSPARCKPVGTIYSWYPLVARLSVLSLAVMVWLCADTSFLKFPGHHQKSGTIHASSFRRY